MRSIVDYYQLRSPQQHEHEHEQQLQQNATSLALLEGMLNEFYQPTTTNARKREIEVELLNFKSKPEAWQFCLRIATASNSLYENQFLWFFSTSTLEHTITRRWMQLSNADRVMLRETLWNTYANMDTVNAAVAVTEVNSNANGLGSDCVPSRRHRDTLALLIALMGKREFPDNHPDYINHCIKLIKTRFIFGINLLRVTSEEVISNREDITTDRKQYFYSCISMCMPELMELITKYLLIAVCHINGKDINTIPNTLMDYSLISALPNDNQLSSSILELLTCIQHLVSWIRTDLISEYFLMSILDLSQWRQTQEEISLASLTVLNELLYLQKPLPYAVTLMTGVSGLLEQHNNAKQQSEIYSDKFRELLRLYTNKYSTKVLQEYELLESFLKSLYCCTLQKNGALDFTEKLDIWTPIIKGLAQNSKLNRYNVILDQLVAEIIRRTQFEWNKAELELLDNEIMEDNILTEWQQFLDQCFDCITLVAEMRPNAVFTLLFNDWSRSYVYLQTIENAIDSGRLFDVKLKMKCQTFSEHLRDFSTICQAVVRIAPLFCNGLSTDVDATVLDQLPFLIEHLLSTLRFLATNKLTTIDVDPTTYQTDLDNLYAQIIIAIRSICPLMKSLNSDEHMLYHLFEILGNIFVIGNTPFTVSSFVQLAASELLLMISTVIRPKCLLQIPQIFDLLQAGPRLASLPKKVIINIYISLISHLILPWKNVTEQQQDYGRRAIVLRQFVECLAQHILQIDLETTDENSVALMALNLLNIFTAVIEFFKTSNNNSKDMLANTFKPIITKALMIFNAFGLSNSNIAITVAEFSLSLLRTLPTQLGSQFIKDMITLFITISSRDQIHISRIVVMEKVLQMFQLVVEQPGIISLNLLPIILDFTNVHLLPLIKLDDTIGDTTEITTLVYALYDSVLSCKWQFFYKTTVQHNINSSNNSNSTITLGSSENLHPEQFIAILNSYGHMLVSGTDPTIVRSVLLSMQNVNERWRLYQRSLFKEQLLGSFERALINLLLSGEGALHFELIANQLFAMGQVDKQQLHDSFTNACLPVNQKTIDEICLTTDIPTFTQKLNQIMQDTHCVHMSEITNHA